jgi:hypothetical protein
MADAAFTATGARPFRDAGLVRAAHAAPAVSRAAFAGFVPTKCGLASGLNLRLSLGLTPPLRHWRNSTASFVRVLKPWVAMVWRST